MKKALQLSRRPYAMPMLVCLLMACGGGDSGRVLSDPASNADDVLRVLVFYDMEGLAGQDNWRQALWFPPYADEYAQGREWLTAEVNAVVSGLYAGGADEVHVVDAHGGANPTPDLLVDQLDPRAEFVFRDEPFHPYYGLMESGTYDALAAVAMHAKTGTEGFMAHTFEIGAEMIVNVPEGVEPLKTVDIRVTGLSERLAHLVAASDSDPVLTHFEDRLRRLFRRDRLTDRERLLESFERGVRGGRARGDRPP